MTCVRSLSHYGVRLAEDTRAPYGYGVFTVTLVPVHACWPAAAESTFLGFHGNQVTDSGPGQGSALVPVLSALLFSSRVWKNFERNGHGRG